MGSRKLHLGLCLLAVGLWLTCRPLRQKANSKPWNRGLHHRFGLGWSDRVFNRVDFGKGCSRRRWCDGAPNNTFSGQCKLPGPRTRNCIWNLGINYRWHGGRWSGTWWLVGNRLYLALGVHDQPAAWNHYFGRASLASSRIKVSAACRWHRLDRSSYLRGHVLDLGVWSY